MTIAQPIATILSVMPYIKVYLDYTDVVCRSLPEDAAALRPVDPAGGFVFSALEQALHIADERWNLYSSLTGEDCASRRFLLEYPGKDQPWLFRDATRDQALASLRDGREKVDEILALPAEAWLITTPALAEEHRAQIARRQAAGLDTVQLEAAGAPTLGNYVLEMVAHETGHRAVLQQMLRLHGVVVARLG